MPTSSRSTRAATRCDGVAATFAAMAEAGELDDGLARVGTVQGDGLRLPFDDATFDRVICSEVLEHLPDDRAAMRELARVLRPGGTMAVTVPRYGPELVNWALSDEYHAVKGGHIRIYRRRQLLERLRASGLEVTGTGPRPRAPQPLLVAALRGRDDQRGPRDGARLPPPPRQGHRGGAALDAAGGPRALAADRQVASSCTCAARARAAARRARELAASAR